MPKKSKKSGVIARDRGVRVRGTLTFSNVAASAIGTFVLTPLNLDARLVTLSDEFQEFRFHMVSMKVWRTATSITSASFWVAYSPALLTAAPANTAIAGTLSRFKVGDGSYGCAVPKVVVTGGELFVNAPRWFRRGTAFDDNLETQGAFYYGNAADTNFSANPAFVSVDYDIELRGQADGSLTLGDQPAPRNKVLALMMNATTAEELREEKGNEDVPSDAEEYQSVTPPVPVPLVSSGMGRGGAMAPPRSKPK